MLRKIIISIAPFAIYLPILFVINALTSFGLDLTYPDFYRNYPFPLIICNVNSGCETFIWGTAMSLLYWLAIYVYYISSTIRSNWAYKSAVKHLAIIGGLTYLALFISSISVMMTPKQDSPLFLKNSVNNPMSEIVDTDPDHNSKIYSPTSYPPQITTSKQTDEIYCTGRRHSPDAVLGIFMPGIFPSATPDPYAPIFTSYRPPNFLGKQVETQYIHFFRQNDGLHMYWNHAQVNSRPIRYFSIYRNDNEVWDLIYRCKSGDYEDKYFYFTDKDAVADRRYQYSILLEIPD